MELLLDVPVDLEELANLMPVVPVLRAPAQPRDRSKWHVTNLIRSAELVARGDTRYWEFEGQPSGIMSWGRIWEAAVDAFLSARASRHGGCFLPDVELVKDEVWGTLDGVLLGGCSFTDHASLDGLRDGFVCETKLRFTQSGVVPWAHLQQIRAYCHLLETDVVCYVSGHVVSNPPGATARMRMWRFGQLAIGETWQGILNTKAYLERCGHGPQGG